MASKFKPNANFEKFLDRVETRMVDSAVKHAKRIAPKKTGKMASMTKAQKKRPHNWSILSDVDYSTYVELGTKRQRAQPFLRPAMLGIVKSYRGGKVS
jgi:HK97 gp10 family phage protein